MCQLKLFLCLSKKEKNYSKKFLKKILSILFVGVLSASPVLSEDIQSQLKNQTVMPQKSADNLQNSLIISKNNIMIESKNATSSNNLLNKQELESMDAWTLLDNLDQTISNLEQKVATQDLLLANSESELLNMKTELLNSKQLVKTLKEALISNKDDISVVIKVAGELQSEIDLLMQKLKLFENRLKRSHIYSNISNPILLGTGIVGGIGSYMLFKGVSNNNSEMIKTGSIMLGISGASLITFEITFNGGIKLKLW